MRRKIALEATANLRFWVLDKFQPNRSYPQLLKDILFKFSYGRFFRFTPVSVPSFAVKLRAWDCGDYLAAREIFLGGIYPVGTLRQAPDLIVDLGGHVGMFSLLAKSFFPEVRAHTFEPSPDNFRLLEENLQGTKNLTAHPVAISDRRGHMSMSGTMGVAMRLNDEARVGAVTVPIHPLEDFVDLSSSQHLLLKCDIEGSEFAVLPTILDQLPAHTCLFIEVHAGLPSVERLADLIVPKGFTLHLNRHAKGDAIDCVGLAGDYQKTNLGDDFLPFTRPG